MIETALYTVLSTAPEIIAITTSDRIYPLVLPTDPTLPALTYQIIAAVPLQPGLTPGVSVVKYRVQIDAWGTTYPDAVTLRSAVIDTLIPFTGAVGSVNIQRILPLNQTDFFVHQALQYQCRAEFYIFA